MFWGLVFLFHFRIALLNLCLLVLAHSTFRCYRSIVLVICLYSWLQGSLRVTVFACGPGESPPSPGEELEDSDNDNQGFIDDLRNVVIDNRRKQCGWFVALKLSSKQHFVASPCPGFVFNVRSGPNLLSCLNISFVFTFSYLHLPLRKKFSFCHGHCHGSRIYWTYMAGEFFELTSCWVHLVCPASPEDLVRNEGTRPFHVYVTIHRLEDLPAAPKGE